MPTRPFTAEAASAELARIHITVPLTLLKKLEKARAALSHSHPGASEPEILEVALDLLLERHEKRKGIVEKPRRTPPSSVTDHIPAHVRRAVWIRDEGKCQWKLDGGGICGSTYRVQFDHIVPRGKGGPSTEGNVRCLCEFHNLCAAREAYGDDWMDRFTGGGSTPPRGSAPGGTAG